MATGSCLRDLIRLCSCCCLGDNNRAVVLERQLEDLFVLAHKVWGKALLELHGQLVVVLLVGLGKDDLKVRTKITLIGVISVPAL